jgi:hypothetical protein
MSSDLREGKRPSSARDIARRERAFAIGLFALGFGVRWLFADGDFHGDEAWYFYLSRGFGREPGVQVEQPWFHIANRPLFYAFYHLSTYGGLVAFRLLGCAVGSLVPVLAFFAARSFGASFLSAAFSACGLCVHAQLVRYSALVFPDPLAAAFGLGACWAVAARIPAAACALAVCCVASKESFIAAPAVIVLLDLLGQRENTGRIRLAPWHYLTVGIPVAYVGLITTIAVSSSSLRLQGWSDTPFTLRHARNMWVGWELWPLIAWLAWQRQARTLVLWLGLPVFYLLWNRVLGRGLAPWYVVGPAAFSCVAIALALDQVYAAATSWANLQLTAARARWVPIAAVAVCLVCLAAVPAFGLLRAREQWIKLAGHFPTPDAATRVQALIAERQPANVLVIDCFWAYRYSHLRGREPGTAAWWYDAKYTDEIVHAAESAALVVTCRDPQHEPIDKRLSEAPFELLYEDSGYLVSTRAQTP